ncbi:hypothetical protein [Streptomyces diastatochromogenes]|nr:hypothetical protein [Streptomyces diastatochromogenes]
MTGPTVKAPWPLARSAQAAVAAAEVYRGHDEVLVNVWRSP